MRAILLILILAVVAVLIGLGTGLINFNQTRAAKAPDIAATGKGVTASGGQTPTFDVETGSVKIGTKPATVKVPSLSVQPAQDKPLNAAQNGAATVNGM